MVVSSTKICSYNSFSHIDDSTYHLLHSSLYVFPLLEKPSFFKLDSFSTYSGHILFYRALLTLFSIASRQILNPSRFLGFCSTHSQQLLNPSSQISLLSVYSINSWQILDPSRLTFAIDRSSTAPQQIHFCLDLVLDRSFIASSIHRATFYI